MTSITAYETDFTAVSFNLRQLEQLISPCRLCPRACGVDRSAGQTGACATGELPIVASYTLHFGEEFVLVGDGGSGTIFFSGCNLACVFCQNSDISQRLCGQETEPRALAGLMLQLQQQGCRNINLVSPTHIAHAAARAIVLAQRMGLAIPVVYNCGGYESVATLRLLEGLVDIYLPDLKYGDAQAGLKYSGVADYPQVAEAALAEMYRQAGPLQVGPDGVAVRGVLVRHLVLPSDAAVSRKAIDIVARAAPGTAISIMSQYHLAYHADQFSELTGRVDEREVVALCRYAEDLGLNAVLCQRRSESRRNRPI